MNQYSKKVGNLGMIRVLVVSALRLSCGFCEGSRWFTVIWNLVLILFMGHGGFPIGFVVGFVYDGSQY